MKNVRYYPQNLEFVLSELIAAPLVADVAFEWQITRLDPKFEDEGATEALWNWTRDYLRDRAPAYSHEELLALRDLVWFQQLQKLKDKEPFPTAKDLLQPVGLYDYFHRIARTLIEAGRRGPSPRVPEILGPGGNPRQVWYWLRQVLPVDFMVAMAATPTQDSLNFNWLSPPMANHLADNHYAEVHLHYGLAASFPDFWVGLLEQAQRIKPGGAETFSDRLPGGRRWLPTIWWYMQARKQLINGQSATPLETFREPEYPEPFFYGPSIEREVTDEHKLWSVLRPNERGGEPAQTRHSALTQDPNFWQMQRVRTWTYRQLVQRPGPPGLFEFFQYSERTAQARKKINRAWLLRSAVANAGQQAGLRSLELRVGPFDEESDYSKNLLPLVQVEASPGQEIGVVIHFSRYRFKKDTKRWAAFGHNMVAGPIDGLLRGWRFVEGWFNQINELLKFVANSLMMNRDQGLHRLICGLDVCSDELALPSWLVLPPLRALRDGLREWGLELGMTAHAGEDFVHPLQGMRRLYEAVQLLDLQEGDRIGHGMSLGIDLGQWVNENPRVALPREERMFDLLWVRKFFCGVMAKRGVAWADSALDDEICQHAEYIFKEGRSIHPLLNLVDDLAKEYRSGNSTPSVVDEIYPRALTGFRAFLDAEALVRHQRVDPSRLGVDSSWLNKFHRPDAFARGREIVLVRTEPDLARMEALQEALREEVHRRGLAIEINPSSNLLVGNLADIERHPFWRLKPPVEKGRPGLRVCIGSDDPLTFATHTGLEYQLLEDALFAAGVGQPQIDQWIEQVRQTGLAYRFTRHLKDFARQVQFDPGDDPALSGSVYSS